MRIANLKVRPVTIFLVALVLSAAHLAAAASRADELDPFSGFAKKFQ